MMKVAFISPYFWPDMIGGMEWYSYNLCKELAKKGIDVTVLTQKTKNTKESMETIDGIKTIRLETSGFYHRIRNWIGLEQKLVELKPDLVHSIDYSRRQSWVALEFGQKSNVPVFITISDIVSLKTPRPLHLQIPLQIFDWFFAKGILKKASKLLLRTNWTKKWILKQGIPEERIAIVPSGITEEEMKPGNAAEFEKKIGMKDNIILFIGTIRRQKGAMLLLDAFEEVKKEIADAKLVFVGAHYIEHESLRLVPEMQRKIEKNKIRDVYFLGALYGKEKVNALAACTVMALPSGFENFGQVYSQAMAQGKPSIGTTAGGVPEIIDDGITGFTIEPWNKKQLVEKILLLLKDKELCRKMGENGKRKAQNYSYDKLAKEMIKIYESELH